MDAILESILGDYAWIIDVIAYAIVLASIIVKLTPTLKDDNFLLPIVKFISKFIALNKYGPRGEKLTVMTTKGRYKTS
jgi:hypothetical protein